MPWPTKRVIIKRMSEDQFTKLFKYMQREFAKIHEEMDGKFDLVDGRFDRIMEMLDADAA